MWYSDTMSSVPKLHCNHFPQPQVLLNRFLMNLRRLAPRAGPKTPSPGGLSQFSSPVFRFASSFVDNIGEPIDRDVMEVEEEANEGSLKAAGSASGHAHPYDENEFPLTGLDIEVVPRSTSFA